MNDLRHHEKQRGSFKNFDGRSVSKKLKIPRNFSKFPRIFLPLSTHFERQKNNHRYDLPINFQEMNEKLSGCTENYQYSK